MIKLFKMNFFIMTITGTLITISSYSWLGMWMGLEINMLAIIPLMSSSKNMFSSESAMKYFLTQAMASILFISAIIASMIPNPMFLLFQNEILMTTALLIKLGSAPFHFWFTEVMEGLDWMSGSIILTWQKIAPLMILFNSPPSNPMILMATFSSLIMSGVMSINVNSLRKIMTLSSINNIAWMLSSMLLSSSLWFTYFLVYSIIVLNVTMMFHIHKTFFISQAINSMNNNKTFKMSFYLNFLSMAGLPPFLGFLPKWLLVNEMISNQMMLMTWALITMTLIMAFTYVQICINILILTFNEPKIKMPENTNWMINLINLISLSSLIFYSLVNSIA
uniref:NADH-ubiquinone oxidoreductase chain 2 n=1 Tax=Tenebrionoidea sp. 17 KM-2017 TaxID=2219472 RepID=A0A346RKH4_9CUCU|nr:NADH dehydrogenase subunit 2 [Tenebrionoidea sp. 17 KM-2017]